MNESSYSNHDLQSFKSKMYVPGVGKFDRRKIQFTSKIKQQQ